MADQKQNRVSLTRYRVGYTAKTISAAWVSFLAPSAGAPEVIARGGFGREISARLRARRGEDLWPGDILVLSALGSEVVQRVLVVEQADHQGGGVLALCVEIARPIPDEFTDTTYAGYWTEVWNAATPSVPSGTSQLQTTMPAATNAGSSHGLYQNIVGDFDVWAKMTVPAGGAGVVYRGLIGARKTDNSAGVWVGLKNDGAASAVRIDQTSSSAQTETAVAVTPTYVRLRREGTVFRAFYSTATAEPDAEADWIEIAAPASPVAIGATLTVQVGLGGYRESGSGSAVLKFEYLRNWRPA